MGLARDRIHADGSCSQYEPRLMGQAVSGPKAILGGSRAGPNLIYSLWVRHPNQTQSKYIVFFNTKTLKVLI